jgi:hypothetical protein
MAGNLSFPAMAPRAPAPLTLDEIGSVIARMRAIARELPPSDGVAAFNELYLAVTLAVRDELAGETFEDGEFLAALDVAFAGLYFAAIDDDAAGRRPSRCWEPLFEARGHPRVAAIQFALAGMNAHINHDLALALVAVFRARGGSPQPDTPQHRDYLRVNVLLERVETRIKRRFIRGIGAIADEALGRLDDVLAMWKVQRARDAAWLHAEMLWRLRRQPELRDAYLLTLDRSVGLTGRGLLIPVL